MSLKLVKPNIPPDSCEHIDRVMELAENLVSEKNLDIRTGYSKIIEEEITLDGIIKLYSLSDGGTSSNTRNKAHLYNCDYYLPSTCFRGDEMKSYYNFEELPNRRGYGIKVLSQNNKIGNIMQKIDWSKSAFRSTNGAFNLRFDIITKTIASFD